ncbi:FMN adenylyltransferase [[Actinobacillus] muris]|uniref:Riboflavin biosynthesis protein n=1 Tax=Muribacter muris TaxID=67855 RepID=A0A0J5S3P8_9PAST|nr:bifunctional riboflavin kinase/FAD synthetase [Muribacter muris]KMK51417.1 FMN adenylyltransferase [[Actinobacillus] muris] [Muribacter muris]
MQLIRGIHHFTRHAELANGCVLTIGNFDGVHLGHQQILQRLLQKAAELGLPSVVMIFEPQPREFFAQQYQPHTAPARLMRLRDKWHYLTQAGVDYVLCVRFDARFAAQSADGFIRQFLVETLKVRYLSVGDDFQFGANRQGNFTTLLNAGRQFGFEVENSHSHCFEQTRISSSRIREALQADDLTLAAQLLGKPYTIRGRVAHGNKLGRTIGFPTANLFLHRLVTPIQGVYAVEVETAQGVFQGIANVGNRPTINGTKPLLEVHIFRFAGNLYGQTIAVRFLKKVRAEIKFADFEALKHQIEQDVKTVETFFADQAV